MMITKITGTERVRAATSGGGMILQRARDRRLRALAGRINLFTFDPREAPSLQLVESLATQGHGSDAAARPHGV